MIKNILLKNKVLVFAILFSAVWHIFWLSAFKVVVVPRPAKQVKFSGISFLGPILDRSVLSVSVEPREREMPEKRYLASIEKSSLNIIKAEAKADSMANARDEGGGLLVDEEALSNLAIAAIGTQKMEPGHDID